MKINLPQKNIATDWKVVLLESLSNKISDGIHTTPKYSDNGDYYFINGNNLYDSKVNFTSDNKRVDYSEYLKHRKDLDKKNTILLSINGTIGTVAYYNDEQVVLGKSCAYITLNANVSRSFIFYFLNSYNTQKYFISELTGSTIQNLSLKSIKSSPVKLPPLPEQNRIVAVLESWDQAIERLKRKIEVKKEIKKGLMQKLLSGKYRIAGYSDEWVNHELEDLLKPTSEKYNPVTDNYSFKCIELEHLQKDDSELLGFTDSKLQKSIKNVFKKGDVLFGKLRPYLRKFLRTEFDGVCSTEIWVLKSSRFIDSNYAYYLVQSDKFVNVANVSSGSRMPRADWGYMKSVNFTIPGKIDEQKAIVRVLDIADNEVRILIKKLSFLNNQKKYLLNNLVTGTIRTPESLSIPK